jgi:hypothetical protein
VTRAQQGASTISARAARNVTTLSHLNILNNALLVARSCAYDETDRVCIPVPY